LDIAGRYKK